jgi:phytoene synthase
MNGQEDSYEAARKLTAYHARSFYFSSHLLPRAKRRHAYAVYACCRYIDDQVDDVQQTDRLPETLERMRAWVKSAYGGHGDRDENFPWLGAFRSTIEACDIPETYFQDLLTGVEMDQGSVRVADREQLERYCYHVAGVVGLMMTRVFGLQDRQYEAQAIQLGNAMQLTNILRDVAEDWRRDRVYLPATELEEFGISLEEIEEGRVSKRWKEMMAYQIERARDLYRQSEAGISQLPADGSQMTVWAMRDIYAGILTAIEKADYQVFDRRCHVSFPGKCGLVVRRLLLGRGGRS